MSTAIYTYSSAAVTHPGKVRDHNEDACLDAGDRRFWVVADGMGGHEAGDYASALIVERLSRLPGCEPGCERPSELVARVEDELLAINRELFAMSAQRERPTIIGSTVVVLMAFDGLCVVAWAGDSRAYRMRDGNMIRMTRDHSEVQMLIERGLVEPEAAEAHPRANVITRAVGGAATLALDFVLSDVRSQDRFLLCSDGLYKDVTEARMAESLRAGSCGDATDRLLQLALSRAANDNVTAVTIDAEASGSRRRWGFRADGLASETAGLRSLVEQHEEGLLPWPAYRLERGRLLDRVACSRRRGWRRRLAGLVERLGLAGAAGRR